LIELRWYDASYTRFEEFASFDVKVEPVLQFRTITNVFEFGLQDPIWSEWINVPTVKDEN